jgi:hypothetical protein
MIATIIPAMIMRTRNYLIAAITIARKTDLPSLIAQITPIVSLSRNLLVLQHHYYANVPLTTTSAD